jgi:hypothetical protein
MNTLKSVFWEYPDFTDEQNLRQVLQRCRSASDRRMFLWIMRRFLEYGRVVDALKFFSMNEITENCDHLRLSRYSLKKWRRLGEVYGAR